MTRRSLSIGIAFDPDDVEALRALDRLGRVVPSSGRADLDVVVRWAVDLAVQRVQITTPDPPPIDLRALGVVE